MRHRLSGLLGLQVSQDEGDRLGMLVAQELGQLRRIGIAHEAEALRPARGGHALDHLLGLFLAQRAHQHLSRVFGAARRDEVAGDGHVVALFEHLALGVLGHLLELKDLEGEGLDLSLPEVLEHLGRDVGTEGDEQRRRLLATFQAFASDQLGHGVLSFE